MQITIISVGKPSNDSFASLINEYEKRLSRNYTVTWQYVSQSPATDPTKCRQSESQAVVKFVKPTDTIILLDERGHMLDNSGFAKIFERYASAQGRILFIIGGAYGVSDELRIRANYIWSLSLLVFPHQLVRLLLIEQLYRTVQLQAGHPYHHV